MRTNELKRVSILIGIMLICLTIGFFVGRNTIETKTITKLEKGETISGAINPEKFVPISEEKPEKSFTPYIQYRDTGRIKYQPIDSAAFAAMVIADYELKRKYSVLAFDDKTKGKLELFPTVQYNKLTSMDYDFTPIIENNYIYKEKAWQPFLSASYSTLDYIGLGGGLFYHNLGFEYQYNIDVRSKLISLPVVDDYFRRGNYHWFSGKYKF
jgi:hypothetical protein